MCNFINPILHINFINYLGFPIIPEKLISHPRQIIGSILYNQIESTFSYIRVCTKLCRYFYRNWYLFFRNSEDGCFLFCGNLNVI
jgi:hypothetical protein